MAVIQMPGRKGGDETGMITKWHKKTGDWVAEGDELFSFDTDEGTFTVKSQKAGRLVAVFVPEGEIVHCPADVGMLTTPSPDSVLKLGRQQYLDETKPLQAREPLQEEPEQAEEAAEELPEAEEEPAQQESIADQAAEEEPDAEETAEEELFAEEADAAASEEELLEYIEEDLSELEAAEAAAQEIEEAEELAEEPIVSEEELLQYVEEDTDDLEAMDEAEDDAEEAEEVEAPAAQEDAEPAGETQPCTVPARPACITAQADASVCMDIAARTGVSLGAMVRFAAMHTALAEHLDEVEAQGLRALDALKILPNVRDLSSTGITAVNAGCAGGVALIVPAVHDAWRVSNDALEVYPCLNLTLAFDENVLELEEAAVMLQETCEKLENLIDLLI